MRAWISTLILSCFSSCLFSVYAQSERTSEAFIETLSGLNNGDSVLSGSHIYCREGTSFLQHQGPHKEIIDQCMENLCGKAQSNPSTTLTPQSLSQYVDKDYSEEFKEVRELIKQATDQENEKNKQALEKARDFFQDKSKEDLAILLEKMGPVQWQRVAHKVFTPYINIEKNPYNKSQRFKVSLQDGMEEQLTSQQKEALTHYMEQLENQALNGPWHLRIARNAFSLNESKEIILENFEKLKESWNERPSGILSFALKRDQDMRLQLLSQEVANIEDLNDREIRRLAFRIVNLDREAFDRPLNAEHFLCTQGPCHEALKDIISSTQFNGFLNDVEETNNIREVDKLTEECMFALASDKIMAPNPQEFAETIPHIKNKFLKNVMKNFSEESQQTFSTIVEDELAILYPEKREERGIYRTITRQFDARKERGDGFNPNQSQSEEGAILNWILSKSEDVILTENGLAISGNAFIDMNYCRFNRPNVGGDFFRKKESSEKPYEIQLSPHTCTHVQSGKGALAHEMGHLLSLNFSEDRLSQESYQLFMKIRQCANQGYKGDNPDLLGNSLHEGDQLKSEEDTADLISFLALHDEPNSKPRSCGLLVPNPYGMGYAHGTLINGTEHSAAPFRVLTEAIHMKKVLGPQCGELIHQYKDKLRFGRCF